MRWLIVAALLAGCGPSGPPPRVVAGARAACRVQAADGALLVRLVSVGTTLAAPEAAPLAILGSGATKVALDAACNRLAAEHAVSG